MRHRNALAAILLLVLVAIPVSSAVLLPGCAGLGARDRVALPALRSAADGVRADAMAAAAVGLADEDAIDAWFGRLAAGVVDRDGWPEIEHAARVGIALQEDRGEIGPTVEDVLTERLERFADVVGK